ncbi:MAG: hypothetical protein HY951_10410 [Bacteroidia bacterium]|nr:hypothetical protein [Bacteroidia bacterium]
MPKNIILILFLFISISLVGQETPTKKNKISNRKQNRILSKEQINKLKDGALFIRLQTKRNSIEALKEVGKNEKAIKLEKKQSEYNLGILNAFKTNFNFCSVYYFLSDNSINIKDGLFDKVVFLNDSLRADTTIKFDNKYFLIAEFGAIEKDTIQRFSHYSYEPNGNWSVKKVSHYYGGTEMDFGALVIKSEKFIQLKRPFPYYVRTFDTLPIERNLNITVRKINKKLKRFYKRHHK